MVNTRSTDPSQDGELYVRESDKTMRFKTAAGVDRLATNDDIIRIQSQKSQALDAMDEAQERAHAEGVAKGTEDQQQLIKDKQAAAEEMMMELKTQSEKEAQEQNVQIAKLQQRVQEMSMANTVQVVQPEKAAAAISGGVSEVADTGRQEEKQMEEDLTPTVVLAKALSEVTRLLGERSHHPGSRAEETSEERMEPEWIPVKQPNGSYVMTRPEKRAASMRVRGYTYKHTLQEVAVSHAGDGQFAPLRQRWIRLLRDAPIYAEDARVALAYGFKSTASQVFETVLAKNVAASTEDVWQLLEVKLNNEDQVAAKRAEFAAADMKPSEGVAAYARRLEALALAIPEGTIEEVLRQRFITGILPSMRKDAALVSGPLDTVVSKMTQLETLNRTKRQELLRPKRELAGWTEEELEDDQAEGMSTAEQEELVAIANEPLKTPAVGYKPGVTPDPKFAHLHCWRCNQKGHLSRGMNPCEWPRAQLNVNGTLKREGKGGRR